ncbi:hypothetical protein PH213_31375 [Streptomyces sp. SRF1]|uniref:hypothetical protein n=1 Tax=Streptomyces sp. SRF1 TaxID=1549642 RepID=UPI0025AFCBC7|nr:hypothetical protein [Streptomyces sp. SRF1]MDN3058963.1 hypothetical protein [Streptomyces sp. SRF1]
MPRNTADITLIQHAASDAAQPHLDAAIDRTPTLATPARHLAAYGGETHLTHWLTNPCPGAARTGSAGRDEPGTKPSPFKRRSVL